MARAESRCFVPVVAIDWTSMTNDDAPRPTTKTHDDRPMTNDYFSSTVTTVIVLSVSLTSRCVSPAGIGSNQYDFPVS